MLDIFFNPLSFAVIDFIPEEQTFIAEYFRDQIKFQLETKHLEADGDIANRKMIVYSDNS
jgi:hypothetical protein